MWYYCTIIKSILLYSTSFTVLYSTNLYCTVQYRISESSSFWELTSDGLSQRDGLETFMTKATSSEEPLRWVDDCGVMDCGSGCTA